jgi:opacity protein-like surface antigen
MIFLSAMRFPSAAPALARDLRAMAPAVNQGGRPLPVQLTFSLDSAAEAHGRPVRELTMMRKLTSLVAALALAAASLAPGAADARDRHGHGGYNYYHGGRHYYGYRDHGDAVAAGAVGLILGLAIGSIASQPPQRGGCYDRCAPPPCGRCGPSGYDDQSYNNDPRYDQGSAYEEDYGVKDAVEGYQCTRPERQYDRYAQRTVTVDVPC